MLLKNTYYFKIRFEKKPLLLEKKLNTATCWVNKGINVFSISPLQISKFLCILENVCQIKSVSRSRLTTCCSSVCSYWKNLNKNHADVNLGSDIGMIVINMVWNKEYNDNLGVLASVEFKGLTCVVSWSQAAANHSHNCSHTPHPWCDGGENRKTKSERKTVQWVKEREKHRRNANCKSWRQPPAILGTECTVRKGVSNQSGKEQRSQYRDQQQKVTACQITAK